MGKFSIIIPTLWKADEIYDTIDKASKCDVIGEIIIIDNAPNKGGNVLNNKKVRKISMNENIYVNKSWNIGVRMSNYDRLCICNDDIVFDLERTFKYLSEIDLRDMGLIGCVPMKHDTGGSIEIEEVDKFIASGFGVVIFTHKNNYTKIPEYVKIWWGDYWLFKTVSKTHVIKNIGLSGKYKTSVNNFKYLTERDTFNKYTKLDPQIKSNEVGDGSILIYMLEKIKGYISYFLLHLPNRVCKYIFGRVT